MDYTNTPGGLISVPKEFTKYPVGIAPQEDTEDRLVNKPPHYTKGKIEVIDFIEDQKLGFHLGGVVKYICRSPHKGTRIIDLKKAQNLLGRYIKLVEEGNA